MHSRGEDQPIAVIGAAGHTGRFVVDELERRGFAAIPIGRDASLEDALAGTAAVINCAGPFLDTALPVVDAALRARIPYLDLAAEQGAVTALEAREAAAREAGVVVLPAAAFYGGLADLLAALAAGECRNVDEIAVAVALDSWRPTKGTRITGQRNTAPRLFVRDGSLQPVPEPQPARSWSFPEPFGDQDVVMLPFSETITLSRHFHAASIESWINATALRDIRDAATPPPEPSDERGRSSQRFAMDVRVRAGEHAWRATALGQDIYAVSAPIVVEALERLLAGEAAGTSGVRSLSEIFDAGAFLESLTRNGALRLQFAGAP